jgi:hypothetical protein
MKSYLLFALLILPFSLLAEVDHNLYEPVMWQDLKIENPAVKDVFINVLYDVDRQDIVIPAFIVKSWMKTQDDQPVYFLSAQPYVCEHSQIPYANQMIKVINQSNLELASDNATPVYAFGNISIDANKAGLFSSAYTIDLVDIQPYQAPNPAQ